jgi:hypothetical protein
MSRCTCYRHSGISVSPGPSEIYGINDLHVIEPIKNILIMIYMQFDILRAEEDKSAVDLILLQGHSSA